jgi:ArsR family metal-binding transcriptional regulator
MIDISKIRKILPDCELSELRPCATAGKVQFHLLVAGRKDPMKTVIDVLKLEKLLSSDKRFSKIKSSSELGVVKASYGSVEISVLASGRVVVKKANDERTSQEILETLAPMLKESIF